MYAFQFSQMKQFTIHVQENWKNFENQTFTQVSFAKFPKVEPHKDAMYVQG
jgi:hypothetical protein